MPDNGTTNRAPTCIACSVFRHEIRALTESGEVDLLVKFVDSFLHMRPQALQKRLDDALEGITPAILLYGDCHPYMHETGTQPGVVRVDGINCAAILLSKERYRQLNRERSYLLLPEWAVKWQNVLLKIPGLDEATIRTMMQDCFDKFVYLDTGVIAVPRDQLDACAVYFELPWERETISLELLAERIHAGLDRLAPNPPA